MACKPVSTATTIENVVAEYHEKRLSGLALLALNRDLIKTSDAPFLLDGFVLKIIGGLIFLCKFVK